MKNQLLIILDKLIKKLQFLQTKYSPNQFNSVGYSSLSPIDNGDENGHYSQALLWALKNRRKEDIKNIALTGPYGSGKSSILKTFQKNYKGKDLRFLNISLATFKEEKPSIDENGKIVNIDKSELLRLIEISILEQIFYHEEDSKIPDSRFKKIKSYSLKKLLLYSLGYSLFIIAIYNFQNTNLLKSIFTNITVNIKIALIIHYVGILIIALGIFFIILKSVRIISSITLNKLEIQNAEIGVGDNLNKSVLNHHIDEILYFFSIRPYNVVVIEDLDRFEETDIFTKLREVSLLLSNSKKTQHKEIVFIYAVRDDMFVDKDRTKFFDFIIPVIPVINSSNSSEILIKKKKEFGYNLSDNLIEDISFFIDDMRLLHNICNEFFLYKVKLNETLNQDKLFAIIFYKNIYPNDFIKLSYNEGNLYKIFNSKKVFVKNLVSDLDFKIEELKRKITTYEDVFIDNIAELRMLYIARIIEKVPAFQSFVINNETVTLNEIVSDKNFEYVKTGKYSYNKLVVNTYYGSESSVVVAGNTTLSTIEKSVFPNISYKEKEKVVLEIKNGKTTSLKNKIQELEKQKYNARNYRIAQLLISDQLTDIEFTDSIDKHLMTILLRNGYIAEDYLDYISLFHDQSITHSDHKFHISIKNAIQQPFDYKLYKIDKLISKISPFDFDTDYILNYDILDFLLADTEKYTTYIDSVFRKLSDQSKVSIEFLNGYYQTSQKLENYIKILCKKFKNIWGFIESNTYFNDDTKDAFFKSIMEYADVDDIIEISKESSLLKNVIENPHFLNIINNHDKLKSIIEVLKIKFKTIDFESAPEELLSFVYSNNYYHLNIDLVVSMIKKFGIFDQVEFDTSNYSAIKNCQAIRLIEYIDEYINEYVSNVYLNVIPNKNEKEVYLLKLINDKNLNFEYKEIIIKQTNTKITTLSLIESNTLYPLLLENSKLLPLWKNLLCDYNNQETNQDETDEDKAEKKEIEISKSSVEFINDIENAKELSKTKIPVKVDSKNIYGVFWKKLIQTNDIDDQAYNLITKSNSWWYSDLKFKALSESKIISLINSNCINPVEESFNNIKEAYKGLNILLFEKRKNEYLKILEKLIFDSEDLESVLKSTSLKNSEKQKVINSSLEENIKTDKNLQYLSSILLSDVNFTITDNILKAIILNGNVAILNKVKLFNKNADKYDLSFINIFLNKLGGNYEQIIYKNLKAKITKNDDNFRLLNILKDKGYISSFSDLDSHFRVNHKRK